MVWCVVLKRWVAGALTRAVLDGRWALMEDIDRAPFEVLSALLPLLERRRLFLPGRGQLLGMCFSHDTQLLLWWWC